MALLHPEGGGNPLLWQHLFWFVGHPEVYIIFLPAAGMVSMMVRGRRWSATGWWCWRSSRPASSASACGCTICSRPAFPRLSLSFFSGASMAVAIPSGIQVFAWIAN